MYPSFSDFLASRAVTRVNGYVAGNGTCRLPSGESRRTRIISAGRKRLEEIVCPRDAKEKRIPGAACPAG